MFTRAMPLASAANGLTSVRFRRHSSEPAELGCARRWHTPNPKVVRTGWAMCLWPIALVSVSAMGVAGCGGSTPTGPSTASTASSTSGGSVQTTTQTPAVTTPGIAVPVSRDGLSARLDGAPWVATVVGARRGASTLTLAAENETETLQILVPPAVGTYRVPTRNEFAADPLGPWVQSVTLGQKGNVSLGALNGWVAGAGLGTGLVTITSLTGSSATGTFSFTLVPDTTDASARSRSVTEGTFTVSF